MLQTLTFAFLNEKDSAIESDLINKNQRLKKNCSPVLAVLQKIADGWEKWVEPGTSASKCKNLICEWCALQLMLFKFSKPENVITSNPVLYSEITSNSCFWWQKGQDVKICLLIRSQISNTNFLQTQRVFLVL